MSTHLLVPELEDSLRHLLRRRGGLSSKIKTDGVQRERMLPDLLEEANLVGLLPGDIVFDLESLLVEQGGPNLRHQLAHGMLSFPEYYSHSAAYLWWLVLHLSVLPLLSSVDDADASEREERTRVDDGALPEGGDTASA